VSMQYPFYYKVVVAQLTTCEKKELLVTVLSQTDRVTMCAYLDDS